MTKLGGCEGRLKNFKNNLNILMECDQIRWMQRSAEKFQD